jgi:hypothetical protein
MRQGRNKGSPPRGEKISRVCVLCVASLTAVLVVAGCKANPSELRGKTSFGAEARNRGNNTQEIRYDARQAVDLKWDNGWSTGISYRRRDIDDGSGDNENRVLVEVGYPLWKAPKKEEKPKDIGPPTGTTSERIDQLQRQLEEMRARVAALKPPAGTGDSKVAQAINADK